MSQHALQRMTADAFLDWDLDQPDARHELIDGAAVAMTGAKQLHDEVVLNILAELRARLRGGPCRGFTADVAVRIPNGNVRRPDAGVHCGPFDRNAAYAAAPTLLVEVLSSPTRALAPTRKLEDYRSLATLEYILLVDPTRPEAILWSRDAGRAWQSTDISGLDAEIALPALGLSLPLAGVYEGVLP